MNRNLHFLLKGTLMLLHEPQAINHALYLLKFVNEMLSAWLMRAVEHALIHPLAKWRKAHVRVYCNLPPYLTRENFPRCSKIPHPSTWFCTFVLVDYKRVLISPHVYKWFGSEIKMNQTICQFLSSHWNGNFRWVISDTSSLDFIWRSWKMECRFSSLTFSEQVSVL